MNRLSEELFVQTICAQLDASIENLDSRLATRLDHLRKTAVASLAQVQSSQAETALSSRSLNALELEAELPAGIQSRLDHSRRLAVARFQERQASTLHTLFARARYTVSAFLDATLLGRPAGSFATACVMVTVVSLFYVTSRPAGTLPVEDEMALIASADDFELYENLDFYLWLAESGMPN